VGRREGRREDREKKRTSWVLVVHASNPSYSEGRDQDCGSKPAQANSLQDPILKVPNIK
jgi:hypothetical protein